MIDKFYLEKPEDFPQETPEEIRMRERKYLVDWMRRVLAEKTTPQAKKAFLNKVHSVANYHGITYEELIDETQDELQKD